MSEVGPQKPVSGVRLRVRADLDVLEGDSVKEAVDGILSAYSVGSFLGLEPTIARPVPSSCALPVPGYKPWSL